MIIFTNGCFDIIHTAHIDLLKFCKSIGDKVIVGLNSDDSIKKIKGDKRPINNEKDRKAILESIKFVDEVIIFSEITPIEVIKSIKPDIIVKGGDYTPDKVVGNEICKVIIFPYQQGKSTTEIIDRIINE
jgi:D-beta-D-heptose 7-phosphate kinase/D-beta-D-heptose 1-phosphate adenosyltransferase